MNQLKIKYAPLDKFKVNERNARVHSEDQVARLAAGIEAFGFNVPVAIDAEGTLIYGHARLAAAQKAGLEKIPFVELTHMDEAQKRAYILADNQIANMATWDSGFLSAELADLIDVKFDIDMIGFTDADLAIFTGNGEDPGDLWEGMPEFVQEDKTAYRSVIVHMKDQASVDAFAKKVDCIVTDKTKFIWFPETEIQRYVDKEYADES